MMLFKRAPVPRMIALPAQGGFLIDTCTFSSIRKPGPNQSALRQWYASLDRGQRILPDCINGEMLFGVLHAEERKMLKLARSLRRDLTITQGEARIVRASLPVQEEFHRLRAKPALKNFWITQPNQKLPSSGGDVMLAAFSRVTGFPIASDNERDFLAIHRVAPLPGLYLPVAGRWAELGRELPAGYAAARQVRDRPERFLIKWVRRLMRRMAWRLRLG
ncbi:hypothetical protein MKK70_28385 [Methylobacterium sp. E-041]|uniref:type II toxin-antitoxin system VapC family toxin n=1 Tax=Methylobacterium sp. E-041 TaxID=2836573 RepID=UPI001FBB15A8|nr:hypothetical protein [Methylobacterium sp. E-041]MCJ2109213.1 hypothetical protein [Methylobacterium sp. E-041]